MKHLKRVLAICSIFGMLLSAMSCSEQKDEIPQVSVAPLESIMGSEPSTSTQSPTENINALPPSTLTPEPARGYHESIPFDVREEMAGISMPKGANISYDDLSFLTVYYFNFDFERTEGHIIVANELAEEVLDIFSELYNIHYPIESIQLIDKYNDKQTEELDSLDRASMGNNNTSAFCYRNIRGSNTLSLHSLGRAIDLNPQINPWVKSKKCDPANAAKYIDRSGDGLTEVEKAAMIHANDEVYGIFISRGWEWGGDWNSVKDYQHFEKEL